MNTERKKSRVVPHIAILFGYAVLAIIMTYPLILKMKTHINMMGESDPEMAFWSLWWVKKAIVELRSNPFFTSYLFSPTGVSLALYPLSLPSGILSIPIQLLFPGTAGLILSYNLFFLGSFALSGFCTYLLVHYLTKNRYAAFVSGLIFSFFPYRFTTSAAQVNSCCTYLIPLYALFLLKLLNERGKGNIVLAAISLALTAYFSYSYFAFLLLFSCFLLIYYLICEKGKIANREFLSRAGGFVALSFLLLLPLSYTLLSAFSVEQRTPLFEEHIYYSADVLWFLVPDTWQSFYGGYFEAINNMLLKSGEVFEFRMFLGFTTIVLVIYTLFGCRDKAVRFWVWGGLFFLVLTLGPILKIGGPVILRRSRPLWPGLYDLLQVPQNSIPLPYVLLYHLVGSFRMFRTPTRFIVLGMFCASVLVGYGTKRLFERRTMVARMLPFVIPVLVLVEFSIFPLSTIMRRPKVPTIYRELARDGGDHTILDLPLGDPYERYNEHCRYMLYQTVHQKRIVGGAVFRRPSSCEIPVGLYPNIIRQLESADLRYVVLHELFLRDNKEQLKEINLLLENSFELVASEEETSVELSGITHDLHRITGDILVYKVEGDSIDKFNEFMQSYFSGSRNRVINMGKDAIFLGTGWSVNEDETTNRGDSTLLVPGGRPSGYELILRVKPCIPGRISLPMIDIYVNEQYVGQLILTEGWGEYKISVPEPLWRTGCNEIRFGYKYSGGVGEKTPTVEFDYVKLEEMR